MEKKSMIIKTEGIPKEEVYISVDIEADGPIPGDYSMISLGACLADDPEASFYRELKPISQKYDPEALAISGLDRNRLMKEGVEAGRAMREFAEWIDGLCGPDRQPIFLGFNATFDWLFVGWYFFHFLGRNPFGYSGWDIKAYYAGVAKKTHWHETSKNKMEKKYKPARLHTHNALDDAREQAEIFQKLRLLAGAKTEAESPAVRTRGQKPVV